MDTIWIICAKYVVFLLVLAAFIFWLRLSKQQKIYMAVLGVLTAVIAFILAKIGSSLFFDTRPFVGGHVHALISHGNDNGFPSDHTLLASVVAVTVYTLSRKWGLICFGGAVIVGLGRIMVHVHHPLDILGSMIFAAIGGVVAYLVTPKIIARLVKSPAVQ